MRCRKLRIAWSVPLLLQSLYCGYSCSQLSGQLIFAACEAPIMSDPSFVAYVGERDFHDGAILSVEQQDTVVHVRVRGASGKVYVVAFCGVSALRANSPEGMTLYAVSEMRGDPPLRRFSFANWDDNSEASLELDALDFS